jgi:hypothetical protein
MNDDVETRLWRLAPNSEFEDVNGQVFRKTGATVMGTSFGERKIKKYEVVCLASPFTDEKPAGRVCSAFFTHVGARLWLPGSQVVFVRHPQVAGLDRQKTIASKGLIKGFGE